MLTAVFATKNRCHQIERSLKAFTKLVPPDGGWKLLVVDNGSEDATQFVLEAYRNILPLEILVEPRAGKNRALNRAIDAFAGDLVVITDDDVLPDHDWLVCLREAADSHPEASFFGGTIAPDWPSELPSWLDERRVNFGILFALMSRASGPCDFTSVFGPNMAVRRSVFEHGYRFSNEIGPNSTNPLAPMGSEWEFNERLHRHGHLGYFVADARVFHIIREEQLHEGWILNRAYRNGLGTASTTPPALAEGLPIVAGLTWRLLLRLLVFGCAARAVNRLPPSGWRLQLLFKERWFAGLAAGMSTNATGRSMPKRGPRMISAASLPRATR